MPRLSHALRLLAAITALAVAALACGQAESPESRIGNLRAEDAGESSAETGGDPREGLATGASGGADPTQSGSGDTDTLTSGVGAGSGGADPTATAQGLLGFDGTKSWEMLVAQLGGVATTTYTASYSVRGNPAVKSMSVVNLPPSQAVTVADGFGNRHWGLFRDQTLVTTCMSYYSTWRCSGFDPNDLTKWFSAVLTTGFSPTVLAGWLAPGLLAEGPVPAYSVGSEEVLGRSATCVTTSKVGSWPGAKACFDRLGVPLTVVNANLGIITMTSMSHSADPAALTPPA